MSWGKTWKKIKNVANKVARVGLATATFGTSEIGGHKSLGAQAEKTLSKVDDAVASLDPVEKKKAKQEKAAAAAEAERNAQEEAAAKYKASILGQRASRIEDALGSQTDFTGDEELDPRQLITRPDVSKKKKLIGF